MIQEYNDLYKKAVNLNHVHPTFIPNWLVIIPKDFPILYEMELMLMKDEKHICNELIIISKKLDSNEEMQLIPIPSFDVNINPQYVILPYKKNFVLQINDTHENSIIYKLYYQSMKCMNIINNNSLKVNLLNKHFKEWINNTVSL